MLMHTQSGVGIVGNEWNGGGGGGAESKTTNKPQGFRNEMSTLRVDKAPYRMQCRNLDFTRRGGGDSHLWY